MPHLQKNNTGTKFNLKCTAQRPHGSLCGVSTKPRSMPPKKLSIAASMNLASPNRKLNIPHIRIHLPQHKPTRLCTPRSIPILHYPSSRFKFRSYHSNLPHRICISYRVLQFLPPRCCYVLLQYILRRRCFLQQFHKQKHQKFHKTLYSAASIRHLPYF